MTGPAVTHGIDGGVFLGRDETTGRHWPVERILAALDRLGVRQALAVSWRAIRFDWREGNAATLETAAASGGRLIPMATLTLDGFEPDAGMVAALKADGHRALAVFPGLACRPLLRPSFRALVREADMPLQVTVSDSRDLIALADFLAEAKVPAMMRWLHRGGYVNVADVLAMAGDCPQLTFDVGGVTQVGALDHLAERIGADRLFIASGLPMLHGSAPWFLLAASRLDAEARRHVGGGTIARLLGIDQPEAAPAVADYARLAAMPKTDTHWHTSGWNIIETQTEFPHLSAALDRAGIRVSVTSSIRALSDDLEAGNNETAAYLDTEPRARGLIVVNPRQQDRSCAEIERLSRDPRFVGVKTIQDFYGLTLDDPLYRPILEVTETIGDLPVMAHLPGMREAAEAFPDLRFVAAHGTWRHRELTHLTNVWFDIATSTAITAESDIADLIEVVGPHRVIFSSDAPLMDPAWTLGKLSLLDLPERDLEAIFNDAARAAFPRLAQTPTAASASQPL